MCEFASPLLGPERVRPVRVASTTRRGGVGTGRFATFNLGSRTDDPPATVATNRARLRRALAIESEPVWLHQVHGSRCVELTGSEAPDRLVADAAWTRQPGVVCAVLTADCLPVVLTAADGACVAVAHAGWRGLAAGVLEATVAELPAPRATLSAWLGPAIGPQAFEVGPDVRQAFGEADRGQFRPGSGDRWYADLYALARRRLHTLGVAPVEGGGHCTVNEAERFFSHRRDGANSGRMATLALIEP